MSYFIWLQRDSKVEHSAIAQDSEAALEAAKEILNRMEALYDGDILMCMNMKPPTLTERGLA